MPLRTMVPGYPMSSCFQGRMECSFLEHPRENDGRVFHLTREALLLAGLLRSIDSPILHPRRH
jgi:hypothetical protein